MSRVPIGLVLSPGGLVLGLVFSPHILTQSQATFDQFGSAVPHILTQPRHICMFLFQSELTVHCNIRSLG